MPGEGSDIVPSLVKIGLLAALSKINCAIVKSQRVAKPERRLCAEVHLNRACRWFCRIRLEGAVPDHSTFSKNRHARFCESELFRRVFEEVVCACMKAPSRDFSQYSQSGD
jgi:hypothetical protein